MKTISGSLIKLTELYLNFTDITDVGVKEFDAAKESYYITGGCNEGLRCGLAAVQKALPACSVMGPIPNKR